MGPPRRCTQGQLRSAPNRFAKINPRAEGLFSLGFSFRPSWPSRAGLSPPRSGLTGHRPVRVTPPWVSGAMRTLIASGLKVKFPREARFCPGPGENIMFFFSSDASPSQVSLLLLSSLPKASPSPQPAQFLFFEGKTLAKLYISFVYLQGGNSRHFLFFQAIVSGSGGGNSRQLFF